MAANKKLPQCIYIVCIGNTYLVYTSLESLFSDGYAGDNVGEYIIKDEGVVKLDIVKEEKNGRQNNH